MEPQSAKISAPFRCQRYLVYRRDQSPLLCNGVSKIGIICRIHKADTFSPLCTYPLAIPAKGGCQHN